MQPIPSLIQDAFSIYVQHAKVFLFIILIPALISGVAAFFEPSENEIQPAAISAMFIVSLLISVFASMIMTLALIHKGADTTLDAQEAYKKSARQFLKYFLYGIVLSIILIVAFLLLIIPGIWLSVSLTFGMFYLVLENQPIVASLKSSFNLVKGRWWKVFGRTIVLGLLSLGFVIVLEIAGMFLSALLGVDGGYAFKSALAFALTPFSTLYMYLMFRDLRGSSTVGEVATE